MPGVVSLLRGKSHEAHSHSGRPPACARGVTPWWDHHRRRAGSPFALRSRWCGRKSGRGCPGKVHIQGGIAVALSRSCSSLNTLHTPCTHSRIGLHRLADMGRVGPAWLVGVVVHVSILHTGLRRASAFPCAV